jgi:hypothetical protein
VHVILDPGEGVGSRRNRYEPIGSARVAMAGDEGIAVGLRHDQRVVTDFGG